MKLQSKAKVASLTNQLEELKKGMSESVDKVFVITLHHLFNSDIIRILRIIHSKYWS
jgi:hypothetical protein